MLFFHINVALACLYVLVRHVRYLAWPLWAKVAFGVLLLVGSQHHLYSRIAFGSMFLPEFPQPVVVAVNVAFGVIFFLTTFKDIVKFITAFTIGHSITLIAATFMGFTANYWLIDAVIALSVCYKGFDNNEGFQNYFGMKKAPNILLMVFIF